MNPLASKIDDVQVLAYFTRGRFWSDKVTILALVRIGGLGPVLPLHGFLFWSQCVCVTAYVSL